MRKTDELRQDAARSEDRVFIEDDRWFVRTREGLRGPFSCRRAAEAEAELFVDTVRFLEENHSAIPGDVDQGHIIVVDMDKTPWK